MQKNVLHVANSNIISALEQMLQGAAEIFSDL